MLRCLTDKLEQVQEEACKKEVSYFEKMEVSNFRNDIILAEACRDDVDKFCADVESGASGVWSHPWLRLCGAGEREEWCSYRNQSGLSPERMLNC